jgi:hypothetical protein
VREFRIASLTSHPIAPLAGKQFLEGLGFFWSLHGKVCELNGSPEG